MDKKRSYIKLSFGLQLMNFALLTVVLVFAIILMFRAKKAENNIEPSQNVSAVVSVVDESQREKTKETEEDNSSEQKEIKGYIFDFERELQCENVIFTDFLSNRVLFKKAEKTKFQMGEIADIMASAVFLENCSSLDQEISLQYEDFLGVDTRKGTLSGFAVGEKVKISDLIYSVLFSSCDDSAAALSRIIFGSQQKAVEKMNEKARAAGLEVTSFRDIFGAQAATNCEDISKMMTHCLKNLIHHKAHIFTPMGLALILFLWGKVPIFKVQSLYTAKENKPHALLFAKKTVPSFYA